MATAIRKASGRIAERRGEAGGDRRDDEHGGGIVEERRDRHRHDEDERQRAGGGSADADLGEPAGDHVAGAGPAQRVADRDERREHDEDRAVDRGVDLADRHDAEHHHRDRRGEEGDRHRQQADRRRAHRGDQDQHRDEPAPHAAEQDRALGERQHAELAQHARAATRVALQHDDVAEPQPHRARPLGEPLAAAADGEQIDVEAVEEREALAPTSRSGSSRRR